MISPILTNYIIVAIENTPEKQEPLPLHSIKTLFNKIEDKSQNMLSDIFFYLAAWKKGGIFALLS